VPKETSLLLARLSRRYASVACISGRSAADVRRLVGVGGIEYAGLHGAELIEPNTSRPELLPDFARFRPEVQRFVSERDTPELRALRVRIEDKGPIMTFHWRGAPDEDAAHARVRELRARVDEGELEHSVTVGVRSDDGPPEIVEQADVVVDGIAGVRQVLAELDEP